MIITLLLVGLIVGSFLNVVIHRLPRMIEAGWRLEEVDGGATLVDGDLNLARPRSFCPSCGGRIRAVENIPLVSYLWLRGRCSRCGCRIPARYPLVELGGAAIALFAGLHFGLGIEALGACLLGWSLLALSVIDIETRLLPDSITLPLLWLGLAFNLMNVFAPLSDAVIGAMLGYLSLWLVYHAFKFLTGKEGMGFGDFKLLATLGAWFGWQSLVGIVFLSSLIGATIGGLLILQRTRPSGKIRSENSDPTAAPSPAADISLPFGPCLALAGLHALYIGDPFDLLLPLLPLPF